MKTVEFKWIAWSGPLAWPLGAAPPAARAQLQAAQQARIRGVCADLGDEAAADLPGWCAGLRQAGFVPMLRIAVDRLHPPQLRDLAALGPLLIVLAPAAGGLDHAARVIDLLARLRSPHLRWADGGLPLCHRASWRPDLVTARPPPLCQPGDPRCEACSVRAQCPGPWGPEDPVLNLPAALSNQFEVEPREVLAQRQVGCVAPTDPPSIVLRLPSGDQRFAVQANSAQDQAVQEAMLRGQLYLDVSDKARLDDFAADLKLLEPVHLPHLRGGDLCGGVWQVAAVQPFATEEAALRAVLADLRGTIVDVGAGPIHYLRELQAGMDTGQVRYVAVEPEREALRASKAALPAGLHLEGTGEWLPLQSNSADALLMLRSFNHLRDPAQALREAARVLRPGGRLVLVDNVLFGLLRSEAQRRRAHAIAVSETPFEHFRNADAAVAVELLDKVLPGVFGVRAVHDVGAGRSNQWLVVAERTATGEGRGS